MVCTKCGSEDLIGAARSWWMYLVPDSACYRCDDCDQRVMTRGRLAPRQTEVDDSYEEDEDVEIDGEQDAPIESAGELTEPDTVDEPAAAHDSPVLSDEKHQTESIATLFDERIIEAQNMVKKMDKNQPISGPKARDV
jgi:hypothetical protein